MDVTATISDQLESADSEEPGEGTEQAIAHVWREVFRREGIGRSDNFFELGGNSLLGMDLTELLATRLGIQVSVVTLFQNPSIRELAQSIDSGHASG